MSFGGSYFAKDHQTVFGRMVAECFRFACFELQRTLFLECFVLVLVLVVLPTMLETFFVACPLFLKP